MRRAAGVLSIAAVLAAVAPGMSLAATRRHARHHHHQRRPARRTPTPQLSRVVDVSQTPNLAEGEETVAFNPANPRDIIVGSNQWQPLAYMTGQDYFGLGPSGFTRCAVWSSLNAGRSWEEYLGVGVTATGIGVSWDEMRGLYPDDVYRFVPLSAFRR